MTEARDDAAATTLKARAGEPPINVRRTASWLLAGLLVLSSALLASSTSAAATTQATTPAASLTTSVPRSVASGAKFHVKAHGFSGSFNRVGLYAYHGTYLKCARFVGGAMTNHHVYRITVTKHAKFSLSWAFLAANPGTHHACAYLYHASKPYGTTQIRKSKTYTVT